MLYSMFRTICWTISSSIYFFSHRTSCQSYGLCWTFCYQAFSNPAPHLSNGSMPHLLWQEKRYFFALYNCALVSTYVLSFLHFPMVLNSSNFGIHFIDNNTCTLHWLQYTSLISIHFIDYDTLIDNDTLHWFRYTSLISMWIRLSWTKRRPCWLSDVCTRCWDRSCCVVWRKRWSPSCRTR